MSKKLTKRINIALSPETYKQLALKAINTGENYHKIVRDLIEKWIEKK